MNARLSRWTLAPALATLLGLAVPSARGGAVAGGGLVYNGGTGTAVFGVAGYGGGPVMGGPQFMADNFTGQNDILTTPGVGTLGGYQTANLGVANNIAQYGGALPGGAVQIGGGNANGAFGSGSIINTGLAVGVSMIDSGPGGGSASYAIASGITTYTVAGAAIPAGSTYGAFLPMSGAVPLVGMADVESLKVYVSDTAGVFGAGGTALPNMVLAISRNSATNTFADYNIVTIGGAGGGNAGLIVNSITGQFTALAVDNMALAAALPVGDVITVKYTLTAITDPAFLGDFDPTFDTSLLNLTGPLPTTDFIAADAVPEPASIAMLGIGASVVLASACLRRRRPSESR